MKPESTMILSIPEIRLCLSVLGCDYWGDLPMIDTCEPVEQRLMNAFLHLIQTGRFLPVEDKYQFEPGFCQQMLCIGLPERTWQLYEQGKVLAFLYERDHCITSISPDWGMQEGCRVSSFINAKPEDVLSWFSSLEEHPEVLELCQMEKLSADGQYDREKLAYFLGMAAKTEEAT